ncbi:Mu transposase domain-containing protein [Amycolatopsis ultiminotia]|uniref:Mu transposase domain-containing protein n=1 Tax=Amycolatopsis ultiminotia TaxID=543629 RepID=UPI003CD05D09
METSFLPGRAFSSPADFNAQLGEWLVRANQRQHRRLGCRPLDRWVGDRYAMLELPPVAPVTGWRRAIRLPRDHYIHFDGSDYSVHPCAIGRRVQISADLDQVRATCDGTEIARHARCWAKHQSLTNSAHTEAAARLRAIYRQPRVAPAQTAVEYRNLTDYDRLFGLTEEDIA